MYSGWISERNSIENDCGEESVLNSFSPSVGKDVTANIVRNLMLQRSEKKELFKNENHLEWTMNVVCYGLTLPLSDSVELVKNCVYLYLDWTSVMSNKPRVGIPSQISTNKEFYFGKMLNHLANLFIPRDSTTSETFQVKFCTQVLFHLKDLVQEGNLSKHATEKILRFFLGISGHLLSVPLIPGGIAEHLCGQLINCLLTVWLHVSYSYFPSPTLWCTLKEMMLSWRHHHILILQWNKLMYALTCKVLTILFGPRYPLPPMQQEDNTEPIILPNKMSDDIVVQCWFRFLHIIGNPVDLTNCQEICKHELFQIHNRDLTKAADILPKSFFKAMQGISILITMFLRSSQPLADHWSTKLHNPQSFVRGEWKSSSTGTMEINSGNAHGNKPATAPGVRRIFDQSLQTKTVRDDSNITPKTLSSISADTNCILHLFGSWLFDVCLAGFNINHVTSSVGVISCGLRPKSLCLSKEEEEIGVKFPQVKKNGFEPGTAQSFSTLSRIFCHQVSSDQAILPVYLSRFYLTLAVGLCYGETRAGQVLGEILLNISDILCIDLHGVQVLVPHILQALEIILPTTANDINLGYDISVVNLRRSCIKILLSMICLPLHFLQLPIQGLCKEKVPANLGLDMSHLPLITFISLKGRITTLLQKALEAEKNSENIQLLLAGAMLLMEDTMLVEIKNHEYSKTNPGSPPCILLESINDKLNGSPKLIHIAKPSATNLKASALDLSKQHQNKPTKKTDIGSLGAKDDPRTTKGLFVYLTKFLCQRLMFENKGEEHWGGDLNIKLAALECISGMSHLDLKFIDEEEAKSTLKWICNYIYYLAIKPPPSHSKDLHSNIVAAFNSIYAWLINHPWLVDNKQCLDGVLEVIELGISGTKSVKKSEPPTLKGNKELKSVSYRVRDAAEALLGLLMDHLGFFPNPCGPSSLVSLLDEESISQQCGEDSGGSKKKFSYFAIDGSVIIAILEDTIKEAEKKLPSAMAILRGPTGKRVCLMQLRQFSPFKKDMMETCRQEAERPAPKLNVAKGQEISQQFFPVEVNRVVKTKADLSIPSIKETLTEKQKADQSAIELLMKMQGEQEIANMVERKSVSLQCEEQHTGQQQPLVVEKLRATRLFLSHMGLLKISNLKISSDRQNAGFVSLDASNDSLFKRLHALDAFPMRTYDTMLVFFVKKGQYAAKDISTNEIPSLDNQLFMEFLHSLGWPVNISTHIGWNGDVTTSWRMKSRLPESHQNIDKKMFYYADLTTELAIHVPTLNLKQTRKQTVEKPIEVKLSPSSSPSSSTKSDSESIGKDSEVTDGRHQGRKIRKQTTVDHPSNHDNKHRTNNSQSETKVVVAWLQDFNDHQTFPAMDLVELCDPQEHSYSSGHSTVGRVPDKEVVIIYIHPLKTGLFRIMVATMFGSSIGGPLVDGMVCSRRVLGSMVRKTVINICKRRRLEIDSYSPPHVCRKIRIQDIVRKYSLRSNIPEFYATLMEES